MAMRALGFGREEIREAIAQGDSDGEALERRERVAKRNRERARRLLGAEHHGVIFELLFRIQVAQHDLPAALRRPGTRQQHEVLARVTGEPACDDSVLGAKDAELCGGAVGPHAREQDAHLVVRNRHGA